MKIKTETFTRELANEILPLGQQSWNECSVIKKDTCAYHGQRMLEIDPDIEQYLYLAENNSLLAMTLREESVLRGYALVILYKSLHLKTEICANVDTFFVELRHRLLMARFMSEIETELQIRGVSIIAWPVTLKGKLYKILQLRGYIADDVVMELKLKDLPCASQQQ